jgi:acetyl esterase/lipase
LSGPRVPGDVWTIDAAGWPATTATTRRTEARAALQSMLNDARGRVTRATESSLAGLDPQRFVEPEAVSFKSHDGETIYGLLYLPAGSSTGARAPVVLGVHGGPTGQSRPDFDHVFQYLLARGYAVLDLNFRGSTGYGKRFARLDNGRLRPNAVKDMAAAVDWLGSSGRPVDAKKVAVMGGSYGGYMAYAALAQLPEKFAAGVSLVGVSNWVTALEGASPQLKASDRIEYGNIDDPADREFFKELSPVTHVRNVRAPLLVSHGANDPRDPVTEADQMVRAIRERGGDVEFLRWPDEGHSVRKLSNRIILYRRVARFLERTLGRGVTACAAAPEPAPATRAAAGSPSKIDEFGDARCGDELAHLDNLVAALKSAPGATGYLVLYGPRRRDQVAARALRMKSYFVKERGFDPARVVAVDGGDAAAMRAELWLAPQGTGAPVSDAVLRGGRIEHRGDWSKTRNCEDAYRDH